MKKSMIVIALAAATMSLTFAQTPAPQGNPPAAATTPAVTGKTTKTSKTAKTVKTVKTKKPSKKAPKVTGNAALPGSAAASTPVAHK